MFSGGLWLNADYIDKYSFALAYNTYRVNIKNNSARGISVNDVTQDSIAGRYQYHSYSDSLSGRLTTQIVAYAITNNVTVSTDDSLTGKAVIISPKLVYRNYKNSLHMDLEYVWSDYSDNNDLTIHQLTPTIGFGFNENRVGNKDWIFLKAYFTESSDRLLSLGEDSLLAFKLRWTHDFDHGAITGLRRFSIDALGGKRVYAVDNETFTVYNLEAVQNGSLLLAMGWSPGEDFDIDFSAGIERYENKLVDNTYDRQYLYISLTKHW